MMEENKIEYDKMSLSSLKHNKETSVNQHNNKRCE